MLVALLMWWWPGQSSSSETGQGEIGRISAALRAGDLQTARALLNGALAKAPHDARLWTLEGIAEAGAGESGQALDAYRHALAETPGYLPALKGKAELEYKTHSPAAAGTLQQILAQRPSDEVTHAMLAALEFRAQNFAAARADFEAGYAAIRSEPVALTEYAQCLLEAHRGSDAVAMLKQAARLKPQDWTGAYNLALAEMLAGQAAAAVADLQPLLTAQEPRADVLDLAASAYEAEGDTPRAVATLRQAIVEHPSDAGLYERFADLCFVHRSFQTGVDMVSAGLARLPDSAPLYVTRGVLWEQLARSDKADADFRRANELDPGGSFISVAEGVAQLQGANFDQALATTRAQIKKTPREAFLYYLEAEALNSKGLSANTAELREATDAAKRALRLRPDFPRAEDLLGILYRKQGRPDLARVQFDNALAHDPENQTALYQLIMLERAGGHAERVRELSKRLGEAKAKAQEDAAKASRYQLVEGGGR